MSDLPPPPKDFDALELQVEEVEPAALVRLAWRPKATYLRFRRDAQYRFDPPDRSFGVLYAAFDLQTAFVESVLRETPQKTAPSYAVPLAWSELAPRRAVSMARGTAKRRLRLIALHGPGLVAARTDNRITTVDDYPVTRQWSKAFYDHPVQADGLLYMSRFLGDRHSVALFDRARRVVKAGRVVPLLEHPDFGAVLDEFGIAVERPKGRRK